MWVHLFLVTYRIYSFSFLAFSSPNKTHSCRYFLWNTQNTTKSKTWAGSEVCRHVAWHHAWRSFKVFFSESFDFYLSSLGVCKKCHWAPRFCDGPDIWHFEIANGSWDNFLTVLHLIVLSRWPRSISCTNIYSSIVLVCAGQWHIPTSVYIQVFFAHIGMEFRHGRALYWM